MIKNVLYFIVKNPSIASNSRPFGSSRKVTEMKAEINFKICDVTDHAAHNYNTRIGQYLKKTMQQGN